MSMSYAITADPSQAIAANKKLEESIDKITTSTDKMTSSFVKGEAIWEGITKVANFLWSSFQEGVKGMNEADAAFARAGAAARQTGTDFNAMVKASEQLASPLLEAKDSLSQLAQLSIKGFNLQQSKDIVKGFQDIAATMKPAGTSVASFSQTLVDSFTKMKFKSVELQQALPGLAEALKKLGPNATDAEKRQVALNVAMHQAGIDAGGAEKYLATYAGQLEALQTTVDQAKEEFASGLSPAIMLIIKTITDAIGSTGSFKDRIFELGQLVGQGLVKAFNILVLAVQGIIMVWELAKAATIGLGLSFTQTASTAIELAISVLKAGEAVEKFKGPLGHPEEFTKMISGLNSVKQTLDGWTTSLKSASEKSLNSITDLSTSMVDRIGQIGAGFSMSMPVVKTQLESTIPPLKDFGESAADAQKRADELKKQMDKFELDEWVGRLKESAAAAKLASAGLKDMNQAIIAGAQALQAQSWASVIKAFQDINNLSEKQQEIYKNSPEYEALVKLRAALFDESAAQTEAMVKEREARLEEERHQKTIERLVGFLNMLADTLYSMGGGWAAAGQGIGTFANILQKTGDMALGAIGGLGAAFANAGNAAVAAAGRIASAFAAGGGGVTGAINAAVQAVMELFKAFQHDWGKDVQKVLVQFGLLGGVSDALAKKLTELAKKMKDAGSATVVMLGDIMNEKGLNTSNFMFYINTLIYGFDKGKQSAEQLAKTIADVFPRMADFAIQYGGVFMDQLNLIIQKIKETGVGMDTLQAYFEQLKQKIDDIRSGALTDLISQIKALGDQFQNMLGKLPEILSESDLNRVRGRFSSLELYITGAFAAMKAQGKSLYEIWQALGDQWSQMMEAAKKYGLETSKAFQDMTRQFDMFKAHAQEFAKVDITGKILMDFQKLGVETLVYFHQLEQSVYMLFLHLTGMTKDAMKQIVDAVQAAGKNGVIDWKKLLAGQDQQKIRDSLMGVMPYIVQVIQYHNLWGTAISKNDQAIIAMMQHYHMLPKDLSQVGVDPNLEALKNMVTLLKMIAVALGVDASAVAAVGNAANHAGAQAQQGLGQLQKSSESATNSMHGLKDATDAAGNSYRQMEGIATISGKKTIDNHKTMENSLKGITGGAQSAKDQYQRMADSAQTSAQKTNTALASVVTELKKVRDAAQEAGDAMGWLPSSTITHSPKAGPSHQGLQGIMNVPYDDYRPRLHYGEKIMGKDVQIGGNTFAPQFHINGSNLSPEQIAQASIAAWKKWIDDGGGYPYGVNPK